MIYLYSLKKISDADYIVEGVFIDTLPASEAPKKGIDYRLHVNLKTKEMWYDQFEVALSKEDEIVQLKEQYAMMQTAIEDLIFGSSF